MSLIPRPIITVLCHVTILLTSIFVANPFRFQNFTFFIHLTYGIINNSSVLRVIPDKVLSIHSSCWSLIYKHDVEFVPKPKLCSSSGESFCSFFLKKIEVLNKNFYVLIYLSMCVFVFYWPMNNGHGIRFCVIIHQLLMGSFLWFLCSMYLGYY